MTSPTSNGASEDVSDVIKSGLVTAGFCPIKTKRQYFAVLCERVLELHDKEKDYRKKKNARHFIELHRTFNVHDDHMDAKLRSCMCWMGAGETFCLKGDSETETTEWYNAIFQAAKICRMLTLCRPVTVDEFFSFAWDVEVVAQPKFKKPFLENEKLPSITETGHMEPGLKRLCFYPHTMIFCDRKVEPTTHNCITSNVPPLDRNHYQEVQRTLCAQFGVHEKYFIVRLGRAAPPGSCNIWIQCDNDEVALHIYRKLNELIDREAAKKRNMANAGDVSNALSSIARQLASSHRDRSHTQPIQMRNHLHGQKLCSPSTSSTHIGRKSSGASLSARCNTMGSPAKSSITNNANPAWSVFPNTRRSSNTSQSIVEEPSDYQTMFNPPPRVDKQPTPPPSSKVLTEEDNNEDSGGTLRLENDEVTTERRPTVSIADKLFLDRKIAADSDTDERSSMGGISGTSMPSSTSGAEVEENYCPMGGHWPDHLKVNVTQFDRLDDNSPAVSDSSDSCYSSMAANSSMSTSMTGNTPRAYSFGGRQQLKHGVATINEQGMAPVEHAVTLLTPMDELRKRSYSLGSKNFITRPFASIARKLASSSARQQRHSQTSASGASLASSGASSFGPSSSSSNHLVSAEHDENRNRSGSFGSGRSTPYTKRLVADEPEDHLVEMDFPVRSCSSSMASIDSPSSRSRTSSFGYSARKDEFFTGPPMMRLEELQLAERFKEKIREELVETHSLKERGELPCNSSYTSENLGPGGFQAIEESDSETSRRGSRLSLNTAGETSKTVTPLKVAFTDDDYAPMEVPTKKAAASPAIKRNPSNVSNLSSNQRKSPAHSPSVSRSSRSQQSPQLDTRPDRSASSPVREVLAPPAAGGLPKRCSVPSMRSDSKDDSGLNYASLQVNDDLKPSSVPKDSFLSSPSVSRTRSQSGIVFPAPAAAPPPPPPPTVAPAAVVEKSDYCSVAPI